MNLQELIARGKLVGVAEGTIRQMYFADPRAAERLVVKAENSVRPPRGRDPNAGRINPLDPRSDPDGLSATREPSGGRLTYNPKASGVRQFDPAEPPRVQSADANGDGSVSAAEWQAFEDGLYELGFIPTPDGNYLGPDGRIWTADEILSGGLANKGGLPGGPGRFLFPEEAEALRLANERERRLLAGELGFQEVQPGFWVDPLTGQSYNANQIDLARDQLDENVRQFDTSFEEEVRQFGKTFNENQRQFDLTFGEDRYQFDRGLAENQFQFDKTDSRLLEGMRRERSLAENQNIQEVLRNPADFLSRAFLQRGQQSPTGSPLTQADLINAMRESISGSIPAENPGRQSYLGDVMRGGYGAPAAPAPKADLKPKVQPETYTRMDQPLVLGDVSENGGTVTYSNPEALKTGGLTSTTKFDKENFQGFGNPFTRKYSSPMVEAMAGGGHASDMAVVGEKGAELVINTPTGFTVLNEEQLGIDPEELAAPKAADGGSYYKVPGAANGGTFFSPLMNISNQSDIVDMVRQYSPPAVNAVVSGNTENLAPLDLGFSAPSMRQTSRLTGAETEALGTRLATEFNTTLDDLGSQQQQLFGSTRSRRRGRLLA